MKSVLRVLALMRPVKNDSGGGSSGGDANIKSLSVTENGTYVASSGVDGYSPVRVNVSIPEYNDAEGVNF